MGPERDIARVERTSVARQRSRRDSDKRAGVFNRRARCRDRQHRFSE
jgi:hypothetical protein